MLTVCGSGADEQGRTETEHSLGDDLFRQKRNKMHALCYLRKFDRGMTFMFSCSLAVSQASVHVCRSGHFEKYIQNVPKDHMKIVRLIVAAVRHLPLAWLAIHQLPHGQSHQTGLHRWSVFGCCVWSCFVHMFEKSFSTFILKSMKPAAGHALHHAQE